METPQDKGQLVPLSSLAVGQKALVVSFTFATQDGEQEKRIELNPGEELQVVRRTFLGDPIEIRIRGYFLALRKKEADHIKVRPL